MDIVTREYSFPSVTGLSDIYAKSWAPSEEREVTAVIQILHGMAEHIARYDAFASYLCGQGFAVFANDHVGHGKARKATRSWAILARKTAGRPLPGMQSR